MVDNISCICTHTLPSPWCCLHCSSYAHQLQPACLVPLPCCPQTTPYKLLLLLVTVNVLGYPHQALGRLRALHVSWGMEVRGEGMEVRGEDMCLETNNNVFIHSYPSPSLFIYTSLHSGSSNYAPPAMHIIKKPVLIGQQSMTYLHTYVPTHQKI